MVEGVEVQGLSDLGLGVYPKPYKPQLYWIGILAYGKVLMAGRGLYLQGLWACECL